jgi:hypothetical protein
MIVQGSPKEARRQGDVSAFLKQAFAFWIFVDSQNIEALIMT